MKVVLITGVSRGIGRALADKFLANGDFVIGTSRTGTVDLANDNLRMFALELTDAASIEACTNRVTALGKKIDCFINNAGVWDDRDSNDRVHIPALRNTLESNLIGPVDFIERLLGLMNDGGHVINLSSRRGSFGYDGDVLYPAYSMSKAALNMFTKFLALRLKDQVRVSAVHPGSVRTDMNPDGDLSADEAAADIFKLANSKIETGQFWYKGEKFPW